MQCRLAERMHAHGEIPASRARGPRAAITTLHGQSADRLIRQRFPGAGMMCTCNGRGTHRHRLLCPAESETFDFFCRKLVYTATHHGYNTTRTYAKPHAFSIELTWSISVPFKLNSQNARVFASAGGKGGT